MGERRVTTAAELDAMTPAQRHQHFLDSIVDPGTLSEAQLARVYAQQERVMAEVERRDQPRAS